MSPMNTVPANLHHNRRPLYLVADIGGTNARFAFVERDNPLPQPIANYAVEEFPSFDGVLDQLEADWLELQQQDAVLEGACLAVAAIPEQREISFTNNAWRFTAVSVATRLGCEQISIINDFAAVARALPALTADHLEAIGGLRRRQRSTLLGAGRLPSLLLEAAVHVDGLRADHRLNFGRAQLSDEAGGVPRCTARQRRLLEQHNVLPASSSQIIRDG